MQKKNDRAPMTKLLLRRLAGAALYAAACLSVLLLASQITLYCDDYRYSTFFRDGWSGFWELTKWHYLNFNGRAFVHFVAELVLVLGTKLYVVLLPLMLSCLFLLGGRIQCREGSWTALLFSGAAGVMAVAALPVEFLSSSLLWIAASFNYLFPLCVLLWALWWEEKFFPQKILPLLLLSLLSGATTEQSGLAGIVCLGGWGLLAWRRKKTPLWKSLLPGLCAVVGYLTVLLAPGTRVRIGTEVGSSVLALLRPEALGYQFTQALRYFSGPDGLPQLVEGFALLSAVHALVKKGPRPLLSGLLAAPVYAVLFRLETYWLCDLVAVLYLMIAAVSYLRRPETTARGLLLLGLLASQLVMIFTYTVAYRTAMPAILLLLAVCVCLLAECLELLPLPAGELSCAALAAVLFLAFLPTYRGYAANALVFRANEAQLRDPDSDLAVLSLDLDLRYRHETYLDFPEYLDYALLCYGAEDKKISYTSTVLPVAGQCAGGRFGLPVVVENGEPYFPVRNTIPLCGGTAVQNAALQGTAAELNGRAYVFRYDSSQAQPYDPATGALTGDPFYVDIQAHLYSGIYAGIFVSGGTLEELFGVSWTYDQGENIYYVQG